MTPEHGSILRRIGVHHVISPEGESGRRTAHLVGGRMLDDIEFDEVAVTIVGVKAPGEDLSYAVPEKRITGLHELIVSGPSDLIERLAARP